MKRISLEKRYARKVMFARVIQKILEIGDVLRDLQDAQKKTNKYLDDFCEAFCRTRIE